MKIRNKKNQDTSKKIRVPTESYERILSSYTDDKMVERDGAEEKLYGNNSMRGEKIICSIPDLSNSDCSLIVA